MQWFLFHEARGFLRLVLPVARARVESKNKRPDFLLPTGARAASSRNAYDDGC